MHHVSERSGHTEESGVPAEEMLAHFDRRTLLRLAGAAALAAPGLALLDGVPHDLGLGADPLGVARAASLRDRTAPSRLRVTIAGAEVRPPSIPLTVSSPYLSTWLPSTELVGTKPLFWYGTPRGFVGLIRVDGELHVWAGDAVDGDAAPAMKQTSVEVTATRSIFKLRAAGVELTAEWLSPVEPGDLRRQSVPYSLLTVSVRSTDRKPHKVQVYAEITGDWVSSVDGALIKWATSKGKTGRYWTVELQDQHPITEDTQQMARWGTVVWGSRRAAGLTFESGSAAIGTRFAKHGKLRDVSDRAFRAVNDDPPVFALARDFGETRSGQVEFVIGHIRTPTVSYGSTDDPPLCGDGEPPACNTNGTPLHPLWTRHWDGWHPMAEFFLREAAGARRRAAKLDAKIEKAATAAQGRGYAALCSLGLRQTYGGCELVVGPHGDPWLMGKEISSSGNVNTVDIFDQAFLAWLWMDPDLVPLIMAPILDWSAGSLYQSDSEWLEVPSSVAADGTRFCAHDIGVYPIANGVTPTNQEQMPIEENAGMLIMAASYARKVGAAKAKPFLTKWSAMWTQWAEYLVTQVPDPQTQLTTNDWVNPPYEPSTGDVNLGAKALIGLAAAGQIATILGDHANAAKWTTAAKDNVEPWIKRSMDSSGKHLNLEEGDSGTWSSLYNAYYQKVIGVELIPESIAALQAKFYLTQLTTYGMPMQTATDNVNKVAWVIFLAAWLDRYPVCAELLSRSVKYVNDTPTRVAYDDRYDTVTAVGAAGIAAHPTLGALFAFLAAG